MDQVSLIPILLFVAALASAGIVLWRGPRPIDRSFVIDRLLCYLFIFPLGLQGLWAFVGHTFFAEEAGARDRLGQYAVSIRGGSSRISGSRSLRSMPPLRASRRAWPRVSLLGCFLLGAGIIHIGDIAETGNLAPGNAGPHPAHRLPHADRDFRSALFVERKRRGRNRPVTLDARG